MVYETDGFTILFESLNKHSRKINVLDIIVNDWMSLLGKIVAFTSFFKPFLQVTLSRGYNMYHS